MVIGDENPMREPERWRRDLSSRLKIPFWTVDTDVVVPSKLIERAQYGAYTIRPRSTGCCRSICVRMRTAKVEREWRRPRGFEDDDVHEDITRGWKDLDRSVKPVETWQGGTHAALVQNSAVAGTLQSVARGAARMVHDIGFKISFGIHDNVNKNKKEDARAKRESPFSWLHSSKQKKVED